MTWLLVVWLLLELEMRWPAHRIHHGSSLVALARAAEPGTVAITIGRHIFTVGVPTTHVLAHEQVHVEQWRRYTIPGFLLLHLWYLARYGYRGSPLEQEARAATRRIP